MKYFKKAYRYLKEGTLFHLLKEKLFFYFLNFFIKNKNVTTNVIQCHNYKKLKRKFKNVIDEKIQIQDKCKSNKVWFCWLQGYDNAPDLIKACYNSLKKNMPNNEIILLSEENISNYVELPEYINEKYKKGKISRPHYSDLLRISLLCKHGGMWIDSTVLCTSTEVGKYISEQPFFVYKQIDLIKKDIQPIIASNWLISSEANNEICILTQKLLFEYWKKYDFAVDYFIFHFFFSMAAERYSDIWRNVPTFSNINPHIMQFELNDKYSEQRWNQIKNISGFHKLNHHFKYSDENTVYSNILKEYSYEKKEKERWIK